MKHRGIKAYFSNQHLLPTYELAKVYVFSMCDSLLQTGRMIDCTRCYTEYTDWIFPTPIKAFSMDGLCSKMPRMYPSQTVGWVNGSLARYVKLRVMHAPGMPGTSSPSPGVSDPDMYRGTCVTYVPCCMSGSIISAFLWKTVVWKRVPAFPAQVRPAILRIRQKAPYNYQLGMADRRCSFTLRRCFTLRK